MNKTNTRIQFTFIPYRAFILTIFTVLIFQNSFSQMTGMNYSFAAPNQSWAANAGTVICGASVDDQVFVINPTALTWSGFNYAGKDYAATDPIYVSTNGWASFVNPAGNSYPTNSLSTTPGIIAPWWDDLKTGPAG